MRILHVSTRLILGGSQENTVLSCEGQARLGHDVHLAFGPIYGPEGSLLERVQGFRTPGGRGITTHVVPDLIRAIHPFRDWRARAQLRALIARLKPDIVHTHSSKAGIIGRIAAWRAQGVSRPGIIHTIHGPPFMPVEGSALSRARTRAVNKLYEIAERVAARRCHAIVSVCDEMTRQFLARGIGTPDRYVTVYSGMESERFLAPDPGESRDEVRARLALAPGRFVIGTVARLAQHKGHDDLLDALGRDLAKQPEWALLWVGDGWWRERLVARARELGLRVHELDRPRASSPDSPAAGQRLPQVYLTGLVPPERVPGLIRAMDVLAHPSLREGLPRTVPQALLCGVCPVAYDVDGTREACIEGQTGRLVPAGDLPGLREAVVGLWREPSERDRLARRGRELCRERFSAETMVRGLEAVYAHALARAREPG
ncbi:MAG: glycosyltransferase [Phycisphaerales bacterium]